MSEYQRVVLVTGSNTGIGYELVGLIAQKGHIVYLASRNEAAGKEAQKKLMTEHNLDVKFVQLEVTSAESVIAAKDLIERDEGRLDVLINNAGIASLSLNQKASEISQSAIREVFSVNFEGLIQVTTTFIPLLRKSKRGYGNILNVSSDLGSNHCLATKYADISVAAYCSSKAAVNTYTVILANELRGEEIKVNCVHPGWVKTKMNDYVEYGQSPEQGAGNLVELALLGPENKDKTGTFVGPDGKIVPW